MSSSRYVMPGLHSHPRRFYYAGSHRSMVSPNLPIYTIIGICCGGYGLNWVAELRAQRGDRQLKDWIYKNMVLTMDNVNEGRIWNVVTCSLMHFNALHLICNMAAFWSLGPFIKTTLGMPSLIILWIGGNLWGSCAQLAWEESGDKVKAQVRKWLRISPPRSRPLATPNHAQHAVCVGASSGIFSMAAVFWTWVPRARMYIMPLPIPIPAGIIGLLSIGVSTYCLVEGLFPSIGHTGHLGGMALGTLFWAIRLAPWVRAAPRVRFR